MAEIIKAPFTDEQVIALNKYQKMGIMHEFTCGNDHEGDKILIATNEGWVCPTCDYTQDWCHAFMLDTKSLEEALERLKNLGNNARNKKK